MSLALFYNPLVEYLSLPADFQAAHGIIDVVDPIVLVSHSLEKVAILLLLVAFKHTSTSADLFDRPF